MISSAHFLLQYMPTSMMESFNDLQCSFSPSVHAHFYDGVIQWSPMPIFSFNTCPLLWWSHSMISRAHFFLQYTRTEVYSALQGSQSNVRKLQQGTSRSAEAHVRCNGTPLDQILLL
jgi:hypothetical protein